ELNNRLEHRPNPALVHDVVELLLEVRHSLPPTARLQISIAVWHGSGRRLRQCDKLLPPPSVASRALAVVSPALPVCGACARMTGMRDMQIADVFVELADTLVDDFDVLEFLHVLAERSVQLLGVSAAGLLLTNEQGALQVVAASSERTRLL